jgi:hypothetical protein
MSNPSRFDGKELLSATGGWFFKNECLSPETNIYCCDLRLADDTSPLYKGTKCLLLLGQRSLTRWTNATTSLAEQRGSPLLDRSGQIPCIASFLPQDTVDVQNFEKRFNEEAEGYEEKDAPDEEESRAGEYISSKGKGKTARSNWRFWLRADTKKAIGYAQSGCIPHRRFSPTYIVYPSADEVIHVLSDTKGRDLFIDIETDFETLDMRCFAFSFGPSESGEVKVYVVPTLDQLYKPAYAQLPQIMRSLSVGLRDNCAVAHNGAVFDFFVFAWKYRIGIGRNVYDTMVAQHRLFPEIEKSLGHCVSYYTHEPYHKNEGMHGYNSPQACRQLWEYCGKDVYTMFLIKQAQLDLAKTIPGMLDSLKQAMQSIRPYLICSLLGIRYREDERDKWVRENDRLMFQYLRMMRILHGPKVAPLISNKKCTAYFHDMLKYAVVSRSKKTGNPSLAEDALLKLRLKYANPVIDILIRYRMVQKETGTLCFIPWKKLQEQSLLPGISQEIGQ